MKFTTILFSLFVLVTMNACISVKPGGTTRAKKLFETFYAGDEGTQYFIKPIVFQSEMDGELEIDFTFRYKNEVSGQSKLNVTIVCQEVIKNIDSLVIVSNNHSATLLDLELMYNEREKDGFVSRFGASIPLEDLNKVFQDNKWEIKVLNPTSTKTYFPKKSSQKSIDLIRENIFILF